MTKTIVNSRFLTQEITGVQRFATEIAFGLKYIDSNIAFVAPKHIKRTALAAHLGAQSVGVSTGHLWEQIDLPRHAMRQKHVLLVNLANTAPLACQNQVVTIHDLSFLTHPEWFGWRFRTMYRFLIPRIIQRSAHVVVTSEFTKRELINLLNVAADKISVVYCAATARLKEDCQVPPKPLPDDFILAVASMDPRKNLGAVLAAYRMLGLPDVALVLVGGRHRTFRDSELDTTPRVGEQIITLGRVTDALLSWLYQHARLLLFPSLYEGFGIPPIEAAGLGCPSVVSREGALPEVMGNAALYCDAHDVRDIATQVERLLVDSRLRKSIIDRASERAQAFNWEQSASQMHAVIRRLTSA